MPTIIPFLRNGGAFDPRDIQAMSMALDGVCKALNISADDTAARQVVAVRIIEVARRGERSPTSLRDRVLGEANGASENSGDQVTTTVQFQSAPAVG